jgi:two-component system phosphate regulon sensor histidine kinase PhoR
VTEAAREAHGRQRQLADALERSRTAARALPDVVVILAGERIEWANDAAAAQLRIDADRDAGAPITDFVRHPEFAAYLEEADFSRPLQLSLAGVPERQLSVQIVPFGGEGRLLVAHDVSHVRRLEQVGRDFVANVSHELRTPLTVIAGFTETLRDEKDPAAAKRYLDLMEEQSGRMQRLVEDLLTLSALESSPPPADEPVDMGALVERLAAEARALSGGRHRIEVNAERALNLIGSEKELASAFGNLVSNAVRYTPDGGSVRLHWYSTAEGADFAVEDSGIGIAAEHVPRIPERVYRVDRGRSRAMGGTGLGLSIVKHALGRHGANLHVGSTPGKGSRFTARFPPARVRR